MSTKPDLISLTPLLPEQARLLEAHFSVHSLPAQGAERHSMLAKLADTRFVQTGGGIGADAALMDSLPHLEIIASMGVGTDAIDVAAARARGIAVTNTPGVLDDDVADLALALMVMCARRLGASERFVRDGRWLQGAFPLAGKVSGKRLGVVGLGRIGKAIALRADSMSMSISYFGRHRQMGVSYDYFSSLVSMAAQVDFLVLACPGGAETFHLINESVIEALGPKGILVNIARGSVVDQRALVKALANGSLGGAGLDVFEDEPNVPQELLAMDQVVLMPHVGSATVETRKAMADLVVANLVAHLQGNDLLSRV